jgi:hypothetical protein
MFHYILTCTTPPSPPCRTTPNIRVTYEVINLHVMMEKIMRNKIIHVSFKNSQIHKFHRQSLTATDKKGKFLVVTYT